MNLFLFSANVSIITLVIGSNILNWKKLFNYNGMDEHIQVQFRALPIEY